MTGQILRESDLRHGLRGQGALAALPRCLQEAIYNVSLFFCGLTHVF